VPKQRLRPTRRQAAAAAPRTQERAASSTSSRTAVSRPAKSKPRWRETIDSFGGFLTIGAVVGAIIVVAAIFITNRPATTSRDVSTAPLMGTAIPASDVDTDRLHVSDPADLRIPDGEPATRGPHFVVPQSVGVYQQEVPDGNAIHALEHGIVWISYNPGKVDADTIKKLEDLGHKYNQDTIVSPRAANTKNAIDVVSWGQILRLDSFDKQQIEDFITTNRNRSPEPFVR
jgi:hypothetical protein